MAGGPATGEIEVRACLGPENPSMPDRATWRAALLACCWLATPVAAVPRFSMSLGVRNDGGEVFGTMPDAQSKVRRLYPGERVEAVVTASLSGADASGLANGALVARIEPCVLAGEREGDLGRNESVTCENVTGITWRIAPCESGHDLCAEIVSTSFDVPPGTYTMFVALPDPDILRRLGKHAPAELRSTCVRIVAGPAASPDEQLSARLNASKRAQAVGDLAGQRSAAEQILSSYPTSIEALWMLADAKQEQGDFAGALATFERALEILDEGLDVRTPEVQDPRGRAARCEALLYALADLRGEITP
jgi:hypothetical protein